MTDAQADLSKLKVPELKKMLKERGLPTSGNKSELISRLSEEVPQLAGATVNNDSLDEELDDSMLNESVEEEISQDEKENTQAVTTAEPEVVPDKTSTDSEKEAISKPAVVKLGELSESERLAQRAKKFGAISEDVRKQTRAERFGLNAPDAKKQSRAERFGLTQSLDKSSSVTANKSEDDVDKLKKRAERFGTVTSKTLSKVEVDSKLSKRAERFGITSPGNGTAVASKNEPDEKLLKRKERFGNITAPSTDEEAKKAKRTERFQLITPP